MNFKEFLSEEAKEKSGDELGVAAIEKIRHALGYRGHEVRPLSSRREEKEKKDKAAKKGGKVDEGHKMDRVKGILRRMFKKPTPSRPITLPKRSSAADRGQGKKTGKGESSLGDQATEMGNTKSNRLEIDDVFGEARGDQLGLRGRRKFKKTLSSMPVAQGPTNGGSGLH